MTKPTTAWIQAQRDKQWAALDRVRPTRRATVLDTQRSAYEVRAIIIQALMGLGALGLPHMVGPSTFPVEVARITVALFGLGLMISSILVFRFSPARLLVSRLYPLALSREQNYQLSQWIGKHPPLREKITQWAARFPGWLPTSHEFSAIDRICSRVETLENQQSQHYAELNEVRHSLDQLGIIEEARSRSEHQHLQTQSPPAKAPSNPSRL